MAKANELGGTLGRKRSLRAVLGAPFEMNQRSAQTAWARRMPPRQAQRSSTSGPVGSSASAASPSPTRHTRHTRSASAPGASAGGAASTATVTSDGARRTICSAASVGATFARARGCAAALLAATSAATSTAHTSLASGALRPAAPPPSPGGMRAAEQASGRGVWHLTADPCARHPRAGPARGAPAARRRREQTQAPHTRNWTGAVRFAGQVPPSRGTPRDGRSWRTRVQGTVHPRRAYNTRRRATHSLSKQPTGAGMVLHLPARRGASTQQPLTPWWTGGC